MLLSNFIINRLLSKATNTGNYSSDELDMIRYSAESILWEVEKIIFLFILFSFFGKGWIYIILLFILLSIRRYAGGHHCKTYYGCLVFTFCIFFLAIGVLPLLPVNPNLMYGITWVCIVNTAIFAPVYSEQKELFMKQPNQKKLLACLITFIWLLIIRFLDHSIMMPVLYFIILQNLQLTIAYFIKRRNKRCQER